MLSACRHIDHGVTLGVESHHIDGGPVACVARPACWVALLGLGVKGVTCCQDGLVLSAVALRRADVADTAVAVINVVPAHELGGPGSGFLQIGETLARKLRAVLGRTKQRLGISVVVADARIEN